jgi:hypothetical protein
MQREQRRYLAPATTQIKAVSGRLGLGALGVRIGGASKKKFKKIGRGGIQRKGQKRIKKNLIPNQ